MVAAMKTPEVREARRLFLFGNGDGRRVLKVEDVARLSGCHQNTVRRHLPAWEREAEEIVAASEEKGFGLRLNAESLRKHESDKAFIRGQIDSQVAEIQRLPVLEKQLFEVVKLCANSQNPELAEQVAAMVRAFLDTVASRKAAEAHLLKLQSHWAKMAGIESLQAVAETREKTLATGRAKLALKREEASGDAGDGSAARPVTPAAGGVFAKRAPAPVVDVSEISDDEV